MFLFFEKKTEQTSICINDKYQEGINQPLCGAFSRLGGENGGHGGVLVVEGGHQSGLIPN